MQAYRTQVEVGGDGRVTVEGLPFSEGERVEVIVLRAGSSPVAHNRYPLSGLPITYEDPFGSVGEGDWEALK